MKAHPLVYVVAVGLAIVVLLMLLVDNGSDPLLPSPDTPQTRNDKSAYITEDADNPSEAVKAVGSQINQLRAEQAAFEKGVNQMVEQINSELRSLYSEIRKLGSLSSGGTRSDDFTVPTDSPQPNLSQDSSGGQNTLQSPGVEALSPTEEARPDNVLPPISPSPTWLWIEEQSAIPPSEHTLAGHLGDAWPLSVEDHASAAIAQREDVEFISSVIPPATIIRGITLTAAIGRLPVRGQLNEPWPVKVMSTVEGYTSNGYAVNTAQMIWDGKAFGDANFECARVILTRVTAVLPGGVISFVDADDSEAGLGYLSDVWGHPCLKGTLVSNAAEQMTVEAILGIAQGIGKSYADTQRTRTVSPDGNTIESVTGEEARVLIGEGFAQSASNVRNYLASRYDVWDAVYVAPEQEVVINVEQPLKFIYDPTQRLYDDAHFAFKNDSDTGDHLD